MANSQMSMPTSFGGLTRFNEEYDSKLKINPSLVVLFVILAIIFIIGLNLFFPIVA